MVSRLTCSLPLVALILAISPGPAQAQSTETNAEKGSFTNPVKAGSLASKPSAGSISTGRPAAGSLTIGKPSAGSLATGRPGAGSMAISVGAGALSRPLGTRNITGSLADQRRNLNRSSETSDTRAEDIEAADLGAEELNTREERLERRRERPRRVLRRD